MGLDMTIGKKKGKASYPTKNYINLVGAGEKPVNRGKQIIIFVIVLIIIALLAKFAVYDVVSSVSTSARRLSAAQNELSTLKAQNADYDALQAQYDSIFANGMTDDEQNLISRANVLDIVNSNMPPTVKLQSLSLKGNVASLSFTNATLAEVSTMVGALGSNEDVSGVTMSTVNNEDGNVTSSITITFKGPLDAVYDDTGSDETNAQSTSSTAADTTTSSAVTGGGAK